MFMVRACWWTVTVVATVACSSAPGRPGPSAAPGAVATRSMDRADGGVDRSGPHAILDVDDRCYVIPSCGLQDDDGCPDVVINFAVGTSKLDAAAVAVVGEVVHDLDVRTEVATLALVGITVEGEPVDLAKARANAAVALLVERGVRAGRLEARAEAKPRKKGTPLVYFDLRCTGTEVHDHRGQP